MKPFITILLACFILGCNIKAQESFDCKAFLEMKVDMSGDVQATLKTFENYRFCGLDSIDMKYFVNGPVLGSLLISMTSEKGSITYGDILNRILPFIKDPKYVKLKVAHANLFARRDEIVTNENWPEISTLIIDAYGYTPEQMQSLQSLYKENMQNKWTVGNLMNRFMAEVEKWPLDEQPKHRAQGH